MPVFYNNKSNNSLQKEGYVIVSLLEETELNLLENFFYSPVNKEFQKIFTTYACNDSDYKKKVDSILKEIIGDKLKSIITEDMIPFWGNFMMKIPSENSNMPLHADWQYVDEKKHISLNVWTPFTDTNLENGALHVIPKSHLSCNYPRGINLPRYYEFNEVETKQKFGKALFLKKGEAIIYDHRLLHYSLPNKSNKNRLAATLVYVPKETAVSIYFKDNSTKKTQLFEIENVGTLINSDFYTEPKNFKNKTLVKIPEINEIKVFGDLDKQIRKKTNFLSVLKSFIKI